MNTNNKNWGNQDNDSNDFKNNTSSFSVNGGEAYPNRNLESDDHNLDETDDIVDYDEKPEVEKPEKERVGTHNQSEVDQPNRSADTSFSEQTDVTPPNKKEFPSVGPAKTDFESRPHGRTTGRMLGHEPGTEGI
jgi:hypothetical protein